MARMEQMSVKVLTAQLGLRKPTDLIHSVSHYVAAEDSIVHMAPYFGAPMRFLVHSD
jgi:hypothetical protein